MSGIRVRDVEVTELASPWNFGLDAVNKPLNPKTVVFSAICKCLWRGADG